MYIKIQEIQSTYQPDIRGIIHLGAHLGEEAPEYSAAGYNHVVWIEGNPALVDKLKANVSIYPQNLVYNLLVSDKDDTPVTFNITEFSQSSSILDLGITQKIHNTSIAEKVPLTAHRLDTFFLKNKLHIDQYNFVNIDLQGYELVALKSMGKLLDKIDWVYTEVNVKSLYKDCALLYQMDHFLLNKGFVRVQTHMTTHFWGDALYRRKKIGGGEKAWRLAGIYSEEAGRLGKEFCRTLYGNAKRILKNSIKRILSRP